MFIEPKIANIYFQRPKIQFKLLRSLLSPPIATVFIERPIARVFIETKAWRRRPPVAKLQRIITLGLPDKVILEGYGA